MHGHQPAFSVRVAAQQRRVVLDLWIHLDYLSFYGGNHRSPFTVAIELPCGLALPDPLSGFGKFDFLYVSSELSGKFVGAHPSQVLPLTRQPGVPGMVSDRF